MNKHLEHQIFIRRDHKYDALYCSLCNEWLEPKCTDEKCYYCVNRPDRPMLVN